LYFAKLCQMHTPALAVWTGRKKHRGNDARHSVAPRSQCDTMLLTRLASGANGSPDIEPHAHILILTTRMLGTAPARRRDKTGTQANLGSNLVLQVARTAAAGCESPTAAGGGGGSSGSERAQQRRSLLRRLRLQQRAQRRRRPARLVLEEDLGPAVGAAAAHVGAARPLQVRRLDAVRLRHPRTCRGKLSAAVSARTEDNAGRRH